VFSLGIDVFRSVQPIEVPVVEVGDYYATVAIPAYFLAETIYSVNVSVNFRYEDQNEVAVAYHALTFNVYDSDSTNSIRGDFLGRMPGVVTPKLEWRVDASALE
jgi:hypothetical protein